MTNFKAVLFDLDGTLIDSEQYYYANWQPILAKNFDLEITYTDWLNNFAGHTLQKNIEILKEKWEIVADKSSCGMRQELAIASPV